MSGCGSSNSTPLRVLTNLDAQNPNQQQRQKRIGENRMGVTIRTDRPLSEASNQDFSNFSQQQPSLDSSLLSIEGTAGSSVAARRAVNAPSSHSSNSSTRYSEAHPFSVLNITHTDFFGTIIRYGDDDIRRALVDISKYRSSPTYSRQQALSFKPDLETTESLRDFLTEFISGGRDQFIESYKGWLIETSETDVRSLMDRDKNDELTPVEIGREEFLNRMQWLLKMQRLGWKGHFQPGEVETRIFKLDPKVSGTRRVTEALRVLADWEAERWHALQELFDIVTDKDVVPEGEHPGIFRKANQTAMGLAGHVLLDTAIKPFTGNNWTQLLFLQLYDPDETAHDFAVRFSKLKNAAVDLNRPGRLDQYRQAIQVILEELATQRPDVLREEWSRHTRYLEDEMRAASGTARSRL